MKSNFRQPNKTRRAEEVSPIAGEIGARIRRLRVDAKISQGYMSRRMGVQQSVLCCIEQGTYLTGADRLAQIAEILSCSLDYLITGREIGTATQDKLRAAQLEGDRLRSALDNIIRFAKEAKTK